jgi:hypothetical protein
MKFSRTHTYTLLPTGLALSARHLVDSALVLRRHAAVRVHGREAQPPAAWRELPTHPLRALAALSRLQCTVVRVHRGYRGGRVAAEGHAVQRAHARAELLDARRGERVEPRVLLLRRLLRRRRLRRLLLLRLRWLRQLRLHRRCPSAAGDRRRGRRRERAADGVRRVQLAVHAEHAWDPCARLRGQRVALHPRHE